MQHSMQTSACIRVCWSITDLIRSLSRSTVYLIWAISRASSAVPRALSCILQTCVSHAANAQTLTMADAQTSPPPFAKSRSRLLSLDEVPHKRHLPPPVLSRENPLVPEPGTPAFAERKDQYAANTAAELRQEQETKRQQRKAYLNQRRQCQGAAEYQNQREEARKFERESERVLNLQSSDAGKSNRSGDHFDIVNLKYQSSQGGRHLKLMDETVKYKAALRTMDIFGKHHSVQHDIITGQPLVANYIMPSRPVNP